MDGNNCIFYWSIVVSLIQKFFGSPNKQLPICTLNQPKFRIFRQLEKPAVSLFKVDAHYVSKIYIKINKNDVLLKFIQNQQKNDRK
ncbi:hypothetical protein pb186bvf_005537 [Paramecium bursaria]